MGVDVRTYTTSHYPDDCREGFGLPVWSRIVLTISVTWIRVCLYLISDIFTTQLTNSLSSSVNTELGPCRTCSIFPVTWSWMVLLGIPHLYPFWWTIHALLPSALLYQTPFFFCSSHFLYTVQKMLTISSVCLLPPQQL